MLGINPDVKSMYDSGEEFWTAPSIEALDGFYDALLGAKVIPNELARMPGYKIADITANGLHLAARIANHIATVLKNASQDPNAKPVYIYPSDISYAHEGTRTVLTEEALARHDELKSLRPEVDVKVPLQSNAYELNQDDYNDVSPGVDLVIDHLGAAWYCDNTVELEKYLQSVSDILRVGGSLVWDHYIPLGGMGRPRLSTVMNLRDHTPNLEEILLNHGFFMREFVPTVTLPDGTRKSDVFNRIMILEKMDPEVARQLHVQRELTRRNSDTDAIESHHLQK